MGALLDLIARAVAVLIIAGSTGLLGGCATKAEPKIRTVEVKVPVIQSCIPADFPPPPAVYADEGAAHMTPEDRYLATAKANQERKARLARAEPVLELCR